MAGSGFNATPNAGEFRNAGSPGIRSTGAYLIGARPFIIKTQIPASKVYKIKFPYITRLVTIINQDADGHDIEVSFANDDDGYSFTHHSISLDNNRDSITMNVRTDSVYVKTGAAIVDIEVFAELTDIPAARFGSGWTGKGLDSNHGDAATKLLELEDVTP